MMGFNFELFISYVKLFDGENVAAFIIILFCNELFIGEYSIFAMLLALLIAVSLDVIIPSDLLLLALFVRVGETTGLKLT